MPTTRIERTDTEAAYAQAQRDGRLLARLYVNGSEYDRHEVYEITPTQAFIFRLAGQVDPDVFAYEVTTAKAYEVADLALATALRDLGWGQILQRRYQAF